VLKHAECSCGVFNRYLERNLGNALSGKKDENKGVYEGADEKTGEGEREMVDEREVDEGA
jgi:hypothetical protein